MTDIITTPAIINFANTQFRGYAQGMIDLYLASEKLIQEWNANNYVNLVPNTTTSVVQDTSVTPLPGDGRTPITGQTMQAGIAGAQAFVTFMTANSNYYLNFYTQASVNTGSFI